MSCQVTIVPREKYPLGQTVLKVNEQRERTHMFSRRYLEEQLMTVLAGAQSACLWCYTLSIGYFINDCPGCMPTELSCSGFKDNSEDSRSLFQMHPAVADANSRFMAAYCKHVLDMHCLNCLLYAPMHVSERFFTAAGRAGEEIIYGGDEVSTINQRRLVMARRIVSKLVVSGAMTDIAEVGPRTISAPVRQGSRGLKQIITSRVRGAACPHCSCGRL